MVVRAGTDPASNGTDSAMTVTPSADPIVLLDVEDLAEADLDADLATDLVAAHALDQQLRDQEDSA